jgi:ATP-dependent protease ClpP protease subunit
MDVIRAVDQSDGAPGTCGSWPGLQASAVVIGESGHLPPPAIPPELAARLGRPTVRLSGVIDELMADAFLRQIAPILETPGSILVELFSSGGDADVGCKLAEEVRLLRQVQGRDMWFLGKTLVASAAVTVMAAFPRERRWLTSDATVLIHGRRMRRDIRLEGPLGSCRRVLEEMIADIDNGLRIEDHGFAELVEGSGVTLDDVRRNAYGSWYLSAQQALDIGLVAGTI